MPKKLNPIPCRQPKVELVDETSAYKGLCRVTGCPWSYSSTVKADAQEQIRRHRADHRMAVPVHSVTQAATGPNFAHGGYIAQCACGWGARRGTRSDAAASMAYHLHRDHGLVPR